MAQKLSTATIKATFISWLESGGYAGDLSRWNTPDDQRFYNQFMDPKQWRRYHKSRVGNYDEEHDFLISELHWCEAIKFKGQSVDGHDEEVEKQVVEAITVDENLIRNFAFQDGDNSHVVVITDPTDSEIIAMLYHQD